MKLSDFKQIVKDEFGDGLKHATPANVRDFLDKIEGNVFCLPPEAQVNTDTSCATYEEIIKDFFSKVLTYNPDDAAIALWMLAFDLTYAGIESQASDVLSPLFE